jgi:hypothetical protein
MKKKLHRTDPIAASILRLEGDLERAADEDASKAVILAYPDDQYLNEYEALYQAEVRSDKGKEELMSKLYQELILTCLKFKTCWNLLPEFRRCEKRWTKRMDSLTESHKKSAKRGYGL